MSKLFTDIAIMKKSESGDIDIDLPIQNYLPKFNPENTFNNEPITLRQLMSHRAGILREPAYGSYFANNETSLKKTVESVKNSSLIHPSRNHYEVLKCWNCCCWIHIGKSFSKTLR